MCGVLYKIRWWADTKPKLDVMGINQIQFEMYVARQNRCRFQHIPYSLPNRLLRVVWHRALKFQNNYLSTKRSIAKEKKIT